MMYKPTNRKQMKYKEVILFTFKKGIIISGKLDVVNNTYVLNKLKSIVTKYQVGSLYLKSQSLKRINPTRAKKIM